MPVLAAKLFNKRFRIVLHYHGSDAFPECHEGNLRRKIKQSICRSANKAANLTITPSRYFKDKLCNKFGLPKQSVLVSPSGGVNFDIFNTTHSKAEAKSTRSYLFASRMISGKGCVEAAQAIVELSQKDAQSAFTFVGDGPKKEEVRSILEKLVQSGRCTLLPSLDQASLAKEFANNTFFMFPSRREGESLGLVVVEAMACGAIPLAIKQGAISEILESEQELMCSAIDELSELIDSTREWDETKLNDLRSKLKFKAEQYQDKIVNFHLAETFKKMLIEEKP
jgi:glycosyltransferase involved in cell wall biosynthesis